MRRSPFTILLGLLFLLLVAGCKMDTFASYWKDRDITIDGEQYDWQDRLWVLEREHMVIGVMNDESNLYVTLSTTDRKTIMQVMRFGFTVWFDPKGGKKEVFGIKYPIGDRRMGMRSMGRSGRGGDRMPDSQEQIRSLPESQIWVDIMGPGKGDVARISMMDTTGIQVRMVYSDYGQLVYELRVPLTRLPHIPYALDISPGETIGVGFETGIVDMAAMRSQRPGGGMRGSGMPGGGRPGGMAGGRPGGVRGGGMPGGGHRGAMPEPFTYWMKVALATGSQS